MAAFCDSQDRCQALLRLLDRSPPKAHIAISKLAAAAASLNVSIGCRFQEYGRHGYLLVVGEPAHLQKVIDEANRMNAGQSDAHWEVFEPHQLGTRGLELELRDSELVQIRILRNREWTRRSMTRAQLARERFHLLVRANPTTDTGTVACCTKDGLNTDGETYETLSNTLESAKEKHPTLALLLAGLSEQNKSELKLNRNTGLQGTHYFIPTNPPISRERSTLAKAFDDESPAIRELKGTFLKGTSRAVVAPEPKLSICVELI